MIWFVSLAVGLCLLALGLALKPVFLPGQRKRQDDFRRRVESLKPHHVNVEEAARVLLRDDSLSTIPLLDRVLKSLPLRSNIDRILSQAGDPVNMGTFVLLTATVASLGGLLGHLSGVAWLWLLLGAVAALVPWNWVKLLRKRRINAFSEQFPEAVDLIARSLRAGHSLSAGVKAVVEEMEDPIASEFNRTFEDYSFGKSLEDALTGLVRRVDLPDVKFFVTAVIMQRDTGGNLTEVLDNISHIIRERFRLQRQVRALSGEGRLSGLILSLMAPTLLAVLWFTNQEYTDLLFNHPFGQKMLVTGGALQIFGMLIIRKLVNLKV